MAVSESVNKETGKKFLIPGDIVEVLDQNPSGLWLVRRISRSVEIGFVLETILEKPKGYFHLTLFAMIYTLKNAQFVTNLQQTCTIAVPTTCQQDVFALIVPSLLTACYKVVELNRLVTSCSNNLLSSCNSAIDNLVAT